MGMKFYSKFGVSLLALLLVLGSINDLVWARNSGDSRIRTMAYEKSAKDKISQMDYQGAHDDARSATQLSPKDSKAWLLLGAIDRIYLETNDAEALAAFKKYLKLSPHAKTRNKVKIYIGELENKIEKQEEIQRQQEEKQAKVQRQQTEEQEEVRRLLAVEKGKEAEEQRKVPPGMVLIPAGSFMMGTDYLGYQDEIYDTK